jgi:hypothetical protein
MAIEIRCSCGRSLKAKDEHAGKAAKCPHCGNVIHVPLPTLEPNEPEPLQIQALTLDIGSIMCSSGFLSMRIHVTEDGRGRVLVFICESDSRRRGELIALGKKQFYELKEIVSRTEQALGNLQSTRRMTRMIEG